MRVVTGTFPTWIDRVFLADLLTVTLITGQVYRWCSGDTDITAFGTLFSSAGPLIKRGKTRLTNTLSVDTLDLTLMSGESLQILGLPITQAAANGALDGAMVKLERAYMATWGAVAATVPLFEGRVSQVRPSHTEVKVTVKSLLELLNVKWPRNLFQPSCAHQVYGTGCGLNRSSYQQTASASGGTTKTISWSGGGKAAGYWDLGVVIFTSGPNAGARRTIKSSSPVTTLELALPLPYAVASGHAFQIVPGCDKTLTACGATKFTNLTRFRGFPWVPKPETFR